MGVAVKLNQRNVAGLKLPKGALDKIYFDDGLRGFGFRLRSEGSRLSRTWVAQYRARGRTRRQTIGDYEKVAAEQARATAKVIFGEVAAGKDPQSVRQEQRLSAARSLRSVAETYLEMKAATLRPASLRMARHYLLGGHFRVLHSSAVTDIERSDVASCLNRITRDSGRVTGRMARSALSSLFTWCLRQGITDSNPVVGTEASPATARERVLLSTNGTIS